NALAPDHPLDKDQPKPFEIAQLHESIRVDLEATRGGSMRKPHLGAMCAAVVTLVILAISSTTLAQAPASTQATLTVGGHVAHPSSAPPADIKAMPRTTVTVSEEGRDVKYEGVLVGELLKRAEAPVGRDLTGQAVASYVLCKAKDGYQVVFSLPELDPAFTSN